MTAFTRPRLAAGIATLAGFGGAVALLHHFATKPARSPEGAADNRALALGWDSFATTPLDAAPLNGDHSLSVRFLAAYDASYRGVIVADESGNYHVGMAPYSSLGRPALELCVGGATFTYPLPDAVLTDNDFRAGPPRQPVRHWRQLALSRRGAAIVVAYGGTIVGTFEAGAQAATGKLRLGRLAQPGLGGQDQFYGLIDDVFLWRVALGDGELGRLTTALDVARPQAQLDFDVRSNDRAASFALGGSARLVSVSREHDAALDAPRLPPPQHQTRLELPFLPGQVWMPIQGNDSARSHHDVAAFALDFIRVDPRFLADNASHVPGGSHAASDGQPVLAPAPGVVTALSDARPDDERSKTGERLSNFVCVEHRAGEVSCFLHLRAGAETREAARVGSGDVLGRVGRSGADTVHLHFALSDLPESEVAEIDAPLVTIPAAFSDYLASSDFGRSWHHVERGVPAPGEWVRRAERTPDRD